MMVYPQKGVFPTTATFFYEHDGNPYGTQTSAHAQRIQLLSSVEHLVGCDPIYVQTHFKKMQNIWWFPEMGVPRKTNHFG